MDGFPPNPGLNGLTGARLLLLSPLRGHTGRTAAPDGKKLSSLALVALPHSPSSPRAGRPLFTFPSPAS